MLFHTAYSFLVALLAENAPEVCDLLAKRQFLLIHELIGDGGQMYG